MGKKPAQKAKRVRKHSALEAFSKMLRDSVSVGPGLGPNEIETQEMRDKKAEIYRKYLAKKKKIGKG